MQALVWSELKEVKDLRIDFETFCQNVPVGFTLYFWDYGIFTTNAQLFTFSLLFTVSSLTI